MFKYCKFNKLYLVFKTYLLIHSSLIFPSQFKTSKLIFYSIYLTEYVFQYFINSNFLVKNILFPKFSAQKSLLSQNIQHCYSFNGFIFIHFCSFLCVLYFAHLIPLLFQFFTLLILNLMHFTHLLILFPRLILLLIVIYFKFPLLIFFCY